MTGFESFVGVNPWTALFTFCNMLITFAVLKKFLFKPVKKMIDDRQQETVKPIQLRQNEHRAGRWEARQEAVCLRINQQLREF